MLFQTNHTPSLETAARIKPQKKTSEAQNKPFWSRKDVEEEASFKLNCGFYRKAAKQIPSGMAVDSKKPASPKPVCFPKSQALL
jgi:hypothetical protein